MPSKEPRISIGARRRIIPLVLESSITSSAEATQVSKPLTSSSTIA